MLKNEVYVYAFDKQGNLTGISILGPEGLVESPTMEVIMSAVGNLTGIPTELLTVEVTVTDEKDAQGKSIHYILTFRNAEGDEVGIIDLEKINNEWALSNCTAFSEAVKGYAESIQNLLTELKPKSIVVSPVIGGLQITGVDNVGNEITASFGPGEGAKAEGNWGYKTTRTPAGEIIIEVYNPETGKLYDLKVIKDAQGNYVISGLKEVTIDTQNNEVVSKIKIIFTKGDNGIYTAAVVDENGAPKVDSIYAPLAELLNNQVLNTLTDLAIMPSSDTSFNISGKDSLGNHVQIRAGLSGNAGQDYGRVFAVSADGTLITIQGIDFAEGRLYDSSIEETYENDKKVSIKIKFDEQTQQWVNIDLTNGAVSASSPELQAAFENAITYIDLSQGLNADPSSNDYIHLAGKDKSDIEVTLSLNISKERLGDGLIKIGDKQIIALENSKARGEVKDITHDADGYINSFTVAYYKKDGTQLGDEITFKKEDGKWQAQGFDKSNKVLAETILNDLNTAEPKALTLTPTASGLQIAISDTKTVSINLDTTITDKVVFKADNYLVTVNLRTGLTTEVAARNAKGIIRAIDAITYEAQGNVTHTVTFHNAEGVAILGDKPSITLDKEDKVISISGFGKNQAKLLAKLQTIDIVDIAPIFDEQNNTFGIYITAQENGQKIYINITILLSVI